MNQKRFDPLSLTAGILLGLTSVLNLIAMFFLPDTLSSGLSMQRIPTLTFTVGGSSPIGSRIWHGLPDRCSEARRRNTVAI